MQKLIIIGAGGLGREVYDLALDTRAYDIRGFVDANATTAPGGSPILGTPEDYEIQQDEVFVCAIGNPHARKRCVEQLQRRGARFATLVHPSAIISPSVKIADGCIIKPYVSIGSNATVGAHTVIQPHATLEHDVKVGLFCLIGASCVMQGATNLADESTLPPLSLIPYK